ncbi:MAG: hypothetical protein HUK22_06325, partial [Thermoguttaceae bacterium]|nr:hypothetical protein [Thermoguttaceae bacterium]
MKNLAKSFRNAFSARQFSQWRGGGADSPKSRLLRLESLESRELLAATSLVAEATQAALVAAINEVDDGGAVLFDESLGGSTIVLTNSIRLNKNVTIDAGDVGITIDAPWRTAPGDDLQYCVFVIGEGVEATLNGLTLTGGASKGPGIYNDCGSCTVNNSTLTGFSGYAIYNIGRYSTTSPDEDAPGFLELINSTISTCSDAAIDNEFARCSITGSTFSDNSGGRGGAIFNDQGACSITNSTFSGNSARAGGGVFNNNGNLTITGAVFDGNFAFAGGYPEGDGGAIWNWSGVCSIANSTFSGNYAANNGGAIETNGGSCSVMDSTFGGNSAARGGAIDATYGGECVVTNSAFVANSATRGGAIRNGGACSIANSTLVGNSA